MSDSRRDWLALVGSRADRRTIIALLRHFRDAERILHATDAELSGALPLSRDALRSLREGPPDDVLDRQLRALDRHEIDLLPLHHPSYPRNLFRLEIPPPVLFIKGELIPEDALAVAIVGPRNPTPYGLEVTRFFCRSLSRMLTIVSGAAVGIDSMAHQTALDVGGRTIGVLGCGIDVNYPTANTSLRQRIATPPGGALVSAYPPGTKPLRPHFPARNVVMAGLVQGVLVVEASATSGALVTARSAGEEGRLVFAVPGDITRGNSAGANALLRDGAIACTSPEELLADLAPLLQGDLADLARRRAVPPQDAGTNAASLAQPTGHAATLYGAIRHHPLSHDDLLIRFVPSAMTQGEFAGALLDLELDGLIATLPGRIYGPRMR